MFTRARKDDERRISQREKKLAAQALRIKSSTILAAYETEDGEGLAVYYLAPGGRSSTVCLQRVGFDGLVHGNPIEMRRGWAVLEHQKRGGWREV